MTEGPRNAGLPCDAQAPIVLDPQRLRELRILASDLLDEALRILTANEDLYRIAQREVR
jgi:hypothetical protein